MGLYKEWTFGYLIYLSRALIVYKKKMALFHSNHKFTEVYMFMILLIGAPETMQWGEHVGVHSRGQSSEGWLVNLFYTSTCTYNLNGKVCRLMVRMILM